MSKYKVEFNNKFVGTGPCIKVGELFMLDTSDKQGFTLWYVRNGQPYYHKSQPFPDGLKDIQILVGHGNLKGMCSIPGVPPLSIHSHGLCFVFKLDEESEQKVTAIRHPLKFDNPAAFIAHALNLHTFGAL